MEVASGQLVYEKTSSDTHLHIEVCHCKEFAVRERGLDMVNNMPAERWNLVYNGPITSPTRLMDTDAMYLDHLVRILKEIENETGMGDNRIRRKADRELSAIGRDWKVKRDAGRGKTKSPLLKHEEWTEISTQVPLSWEHWGYNHGR